MFYCFTFKCFHKSWDSKERTQFKMLFLISNTSSYNCYRFNNWTYHSQYSIQDNGHRDFCVIIQVPDRSYVLYLKDRWEGFQQARGRGFGTVRWGPALNWEQNQKQQQQQQRINKGNCLLHENNTKSSIGQLGIFRYGFVPLPTNLIPL